MGQSIHKIFRLLLLWGTLLVVQPALAQFTANFQTNLVSGVTNNWPGPYLVGSNTFGDALLIRSAGVLTNLDAYAGFLPTSSSNYVSVSGSGSVWSNLTMYLGYAGGANSLVISNAGRVENRGLAYIGYSGSSLSNRVLVTGTNSILNTASEMYIGETGSGNSLVISNGGRVANVNSYLGEDYGGGGNSVLVTGSGSVWSNSTCYVGSKSPNNNLTIAKGGRVRSTYAYIGLWDMAPSNSVVVSDAGSLWDNSTEASDINFGQFASYNSLLVTNGGQVLGYYAYFGRLSGGGHNSALITGPGSSFSVNCYIYAGFQGHDNSFTAANGATISDKFCYISKEAGSMNNAVLVTGTNTSWQNSYSVFVGDTGSHGSLTVSNGATMSSTEESILGYAATSDNNRVVVTGGGAVLKCVNNTWVGYNGSDNTLTISNGGRVLDAYGLLGSNTGSENNNMLVVGNGSLWTNISDVYVGWSGAANTLTISNGGWVRNYAGIIGYDVSSSNNLAVVTGAGSVWSNSAALMIGNSGCSNTLVIGDGGLVVDHWGLIGEEDTSNDNTVYVETGGTWRNQVIAVGDLGSHNALVVDGGWVTATNLQVGYGSLYCNNLAVLNGGEIDVTNATSTAEMEVYAGGFLLIDGTLRVDRLIVTNPCAQFMKIGGNLIYKNLQLNPNSDADADGIPNGWEQARGLDPFDPYDGAADTDGDGMSNLQEYMAGTNPTNATSRLRVTSQVMTGSNVRVSWSAVGGKSYVLQVAPAPGTNFTDLSPVIAIPGTAETITNYLHLGAKTNYPARYYRVRVAP